MKFIVWDLKRFFFLMYCCLLFFWDKPRLALRPQWQSSRLSSHLSRLLELQQCTTIPSSCGSFSVDQSQSKVSNKRATLACGPDNSRVISAYTWMLTTPKVWRSIFNTSVECHFRLLLTFLPYSFKFHSRPSSAQLGNEHPEHRAPLDISNQSCKVDLAPILLKWHSCWLVFLSIVFYYIVLC